MQESVFSAQGSVFTVRFSVISVQDVCFSVQCSVCSVQCSVCTLNAIIKALSTYRNLSILGNLSLGVVDDLMDLHIPRPARVLDSGGFIQLGSLIKFTMP